MWGACFLGPQIHLGKWGIPSGPACQGRSLGSRWLGGCNPAPTGSLGQSGCPSLPLASPRTPVPSRLPTCRGAGHLPPPTLAQGPVRAAPSFLPRHRAQHLPLRQEAPGPARGGPASREAWLVIRVATWPPLVAPLGVGQGCYLEAVPALGRGGDCCTSGWLPERRLSPGCRAGLRTGRSEGRPLPLWTLYPSWPLLSGSWLAGTGWPPGALTCPCQLAGQRPQPEAVGGVCVGHGGQSWAGGFNRADPKLGGRVLGTLIPFGDEKFWKE